MTKQEIRYLKAYNLSVKILVVTAILFSAIYLLQKKYIPAIILVIIVLFTLIPCIGFKKKINVKIKSYIVSTSMFLCAFAGSVANHELLYGIPIILTAVLLSMFYDNVNLTKFIICIANVAMLITVIFLRNIAFDTFEPILFLRGWITMLYGMSITYIIVKRNSLNLASSEENEEHANQLLEKVNIQMQKEKENQNAMKKTEEQISKVSQSIELSAKGISEIVDSLSDGSARQASSVEELSATLNELRNGAEVNDEIANNLKSISDLTSENVTLGNNQITEMVKAMQKIKLSSDKINSIVKDINSISFQTNILALNASVEAARAGDAGKGFAVVANEVRNLSSKSAEAANRTAVLISETIDAVTEGNLIVDKTAKMFSNISDNTATSKEFVNKILKSSNGQKTSLSEIVYGIQQISDVVQNNTATAEESAASTHELFNQTKILNNIISGSKTAKHL